METLYLSGHLRNTDRGKDIVSQLYKIQSNKKYDFVISEIPHPYHKKNEWCRDYMPVLRNDGSMVLFNYMPSYMQDRKDYRSMIPDQSQICRSLGIKVQKSNIILDGGAVEILGDKAILSDRVLFENTSSWTKGKPDIISAVKKALKVKELIVVPSDPWDFTGHVDGMVRFINEDKVLVNDMSGMNNLMEGELLYDLQYYNAWYDNFIKTLKNAKLEIEVLPCHVHDNQDDDSAVGIYLNYLVMDKVIIMPSFGRHPNNNKAKTELQKHFPEKEILSVEASELAKFGGIINCVTWVG